MPRIARIVVPGQPHHITQRGNNRHDVFFVDDDRWVYLELLQDQCQLHGVSVLGYCLMSNHVHLIATPPHQHSLARALGRAHFGYSQYINRAHGRCGHLWQNRFFSCPLDETHAWRALVYVERNPVRAKMVRVAWRYLWSSAAAHIGGNDASGLLDLVWWRRQWRPARWRRELESPDDQGVASQLRSHTHRGRPLATDGILSKLERRMGRRLRALPVGRPKKSAGERKKK